MPERVGAVLLLELLLQPPNFENIQNISNFIAASLQTEAQVTCSFAAVLSAVAWPHASALANAKMACLNLHRSDNGHYFVQYQYRDYHDCASLLHLAHLLLYIKDSSKRK